MTRAVPRDLHPVAWWAWAVGLAGAASMTTNPLLLLLLASAAGVVVAARRSAQPWGRSFRLYLALAVLIVVVRVLFRIVFGGVESGHVLVRLPEVPLPDWVAGVRLLGPVTRESVLAGLYDGMRLGTIVLCVGAANSLANPKRLLAAVPAALHEVGTALVVAVTIFPQLADSVRRVRAAQALRGGAGGRVGRSRRFLVPVLEDALERSLALAAGMDTRGYGRSGGAGRGERAVTGALLLAALVGLSVGGYAVLDPTAPRWLAEPMLATGLLVAAAGLASAGRRVARTRYRPDRWRAPELGVVAVAVVVAAAGHHLAAAHLVVAHPGVETVPYLSVEALLIGLAAVLPVVFTPSPPDPLATAATVPEPLRRSVEVVT